jgi:hypothetical protein
MKAQYSGFDLSRYKLPDIKTSRLDAYLDYDNSLDQYHYMPSNSDSSESRRNSYAGNLNLNYYHFRYTEKYLGQFNAFASGQLNNYKSKNDNSNSSSYNNLLNFALSNINRFYKQNSNFLEVDAEFSVLHNKDHSESLSDENSIDQFTAFLSIPVSIGHGRIEPVQDLRLAIYILEELNKAGRIKSLPSDQVLLEMAKEISRIKRQRFFDTRIRKIKELQVVDSFLVANNIVSSNDITYFTILNDQWSYAYGPERTAGFAVNFGIDDNIEINRTNQDGNINGIPYKNETDVNSYYLAGFSQVRYDKPINLYWQTSATLKLSYGFELTRDRKNQNISELNYRTDIFNTSVSYSIQFIPNSRTSAGLSLSGIYIDSKSDRKTGDPAPAGSRITEKNINCIAGFNVNYYFSPQFRINLNSDLRYIGERNRNIGNTEPSLGYFRTSLQNYFALSLIYSFF